MVDPVMISAGTQIAGGFLGAGGSSKAGNAQARIAEYKARIDERNAESALIQGRHLLLIAKADSLEDTRDAFDLARSAGAYFAKAGVVSGTGTAALVAAESAKRADEAIANNLYNARVEALAMRERALGFQMQAGVTRAEGAARRDAVRGEGIASLLGTVGSVAGKIFT